ncbi:thioredoxin domain-containing protein [Vulcanisaeta thermophila]|uniref:thioredoxin domain-containing protein n=1 Tax=Vulcanisaeta thermophila TaxID=867917 RepID=UPI001EE38019|nr:thioredoxin domain-containing protein [Vulcanisaeta thermophila]
MSNINKALLMAVIALAVALIAVVLYFTVIAKTPTGKAATQSSSQTGSLTSLLMEAFSDGVKLWFGLVCVYHNYGESAALSLMHLLYTIGYEYNVAYVQTGNATYEVVYPIIQYNYLTSKYPSCSVNYNMSYLVNYVASAGSNITIVQKYLGIPSSFMGTPLFLIYNRLNNITYVVVGASPAPFTALNYSRAGVTTVLTYQGQELGYSFRANATQVGFINGLVSEGLGFGNPNANIVIIELMDPTCPYCAVFDVQYGSELDSLVNNGTIYYVLLYFPTHILGYYPGGIG